MSRPLSSLTYWALSYLLHRTCSYELTTYDMARHSRSRSRSPRRSHGEKGKRDDEPRSSRADDRDAHKSKRHRSRSRDDDRERNSSRRKERSRSRDRTDKKYVYRSVLYICHPTNLIRRKRNKSEERKARKEEKKRTREEEEARQVAELSVYSATDNPFHDVNLGQQFRWHKKAEKERKSGLSLAEAQRRDAIRRQDAKEELERLNRRRAEREVEQRLREEEELRMQRLQESAQMSEWLEKEEDFQLEQERARATIRIKEKRAKAIDFLALNLKYVNPPDDEEKPEDNDDAALEIDLDEPYKIFDVSRPHLFYGVLLTSNH